MNVLILSGNITKDAEIKSVGDKNVINFSLAVNEGFGDKATTMFVNCKLWGSEKQAETLTKGTRVTIKGKLSIRKHEDKYYTEALIDGYNGYEFSSKKESKEDNSAAFTDFGIPVFDGDEDPLF